MAEGWLRPLAGNRFESLSTGANPAGSVHPLAVQVMRESGVDLTPCHESLHHCFYHASVRNGDSGRPSLL